MSILSFSIKLSANISAVFLLSGCPAPNPVDACINAIEQEIRSLENEREVARSDLARGYRIVSEEEDLFGNFRCIQKEQAPAVIDGVINVLQFGAGSILFSGPAPRGSCDNTAYISSLVRDALAEDRDLNFSSGSIARLYCSGDSAAQVCSFSGTINVQRRESVDIIALNETLRFLNTEIPILRKSAEERKKRCTASFAPE